MNTCNVYKDEWYPVYTIEDRHGGYEVDLTDEEIARVNAALAEFKSTQNFLGDKINEAIERAAR